MKEHLMKTNRLRVIFSVAAGLTIFASLMLAHHGASNYDRDHPITLMGVVMDYQFVNPHVLVHIGVQNANGSTENWVAETSPPARLFRAGWRTDSLKPGDKVTIEGFPMKDGSKTMGLRKLTTADGKELSPGE